ncbi:MAG TPA: ABC transporter substrate-binding protein [Stellaceae bacterium]|jgi:ABC-type nitrate/sulfonate/bicarbonate transport system substrate-binding protein
MFRKTIAAALLSAAIAAPFVPPALAADAPKIVFAPPGIPPIFISIISFVAKDQGFFKQYGADIELRQFDNGTAAARAVVSGDIDAAMSSTPLLISQIANANVDLVGIYGFPKPDFELGTSNAGKASCADAKGQQVGVDTPGGARSIALKQILEMGCHLSMDDVQQVALGSNTAQALIAGQIQYGILHLDDVPEIESHGKKITLVKTLLDSNPTAQNLIIVARRDDIAKKRDGFVRMAAALIAATHFMADPKNAEKVATSAEVTGRSHEAAMAAIKAYLQYGLWPVDNDGMPQAALEAYTADQVKSGAIKDGTAPTYQRLVDASIWRDAKALVDKQ